MSENNNHPLTDEQTFFLALREHMKDVLAASMKNGKLITPEELQEQLTQYGKEHSKSKDEVMTWLQQANRDLVHEYISKKTQGTTSDDLPISLSNEGTAYNIAQDYIINSVLLQKFPPTNTVEETFDPKHHITPEDLLDILEKEGLSDTVGKALFANDNKGKDFIVSDVHGGTDLGPAIQAALGQHMNNTMRIPDSKYAVEINEEKPQDSAGINTNITAFHDANEDNSNFVGRYDANTDTIHLAVNNEPEYKKLLREFLVNNNYTFKYDSEEAAKPWYLSPEEIASMKIDPFSMGSLNPISATPLDLVAKDIPDDIAKLIADYVEIQRNNPGVFSERLTKIPVLDITKPVPDSSDEKTVTPAIQQENYKRLTEKLQSELIPDLKGPSILSAPAVVGRDFSKEAIKKHIQETSGKMGNDNNPDKPKNSI